MLKLGREPERLQVHLSRDADFRVTLSASEAYPAGSAVSLEVALGDGTVVDTWSASVSGADAVFDVDKTAVNAVLATTGPKQARLYFVNGTDDDLWAHGRVREF